MKKHLFFLLLLVFALPAMAQTVLFEDDFAMANFKPQWTPVPGIPNGVVDLANSIGFNDSRGARLGKSSNTGGYVTNALDLHLNLSGQTQVAMTFKIKDNGDDTNYEDAIYFSNNGGASFTPVPVFAFQPSDWCEQYGQFPPLDIDYLAAQVQPPLTLTSDFVIRFQQHGQNSFSSYGDGFYLDDVNVYVPNLTYQPLPFTDNFETATFGSMWTWSFADQTNTLAAIPTRPSNIVDLANSIGFNSSRGVRMGKACGDGYATNALDLHLNLAGQTQVAITFKIKDNGDDTNYDDAIYFSNNGGVSFTSEPVFAFQPSDWCEQYGQFPPLDIDKLAAQAGLNLTSNFVIRFQQHGQNSFSSYGDGFYLDDVNVYVPNLTYQPLPYTDNFETEAFGSMWTWSFADQTNTLAAIPTRPSNIVELANSIGFNSSRGVRMGKACGDGYATNTLDLHLNLAGQTQVAMTFKIRDNGDDTNDDDAIYFSNDGGANFEKVYSFVWGSTAEIYTDYGINVSNLAVANGLSLTNQFVIRIQQHGQNSFSSYGDGIYLDNVQINGIFTGIDPATSGNNLLVIYPNPAQDWLHLNTDAFPASVSPVVTLQLFNTNGQLVLEKKLQTNQINTPLSIAQLPAGLYNVQLTTDQTTYCQKLLKQ